jgi:hypothetical protein
MTENKQSKSKGGLVFEAYTAWCRKHGANPEPKIHFFTGLRNKGILKAFATIDGATERNVVVDWKLKPLAA